MSQAFTFSGELWQNNGPRETQPFPRASTEKGPRPSPPQAEPPPAPGQGTAPGSFRASSPRGSNTRRARARRQRPVTAPRPGPRQRRLPAAPAPPSPHRAPGELRRADRAPDRRGRGAAAPQPEQGGGRAPRGTAPARRSARKAAAGRRDAGRGLTLGERVQHPRLLQVPAELLPLGVRGLREDAHTVRSATRTPPHLRRRPVGPGRPPSPPRGRHEGPSTAPVRVPPRRRRAPSYLAMRHQPRTAPAPAPRLRPAPRAALRRFPRRRASGHAPPPANRAPGHAPPRAPRPARGTGVSRRPRGSRGETSAPKRKCLSRARSETRGRSQPCGFCETPGYLRAGKIGWL